MTLPPETLTLHAPAKVNLWLEVLAKRPDGFHEIDTVMVPLRWGDTLAGRRREDDCLELHVDWSALTGPTPTLSAADNLVYKALEKIRPAGAGADVWLVKRVPAQAGLGGGSSDAAAALRLGNQMWNLGLSDERLAEIAAELGSDVPFFLGRGAARARGRGEHIEAVEGVPPVHLVVVKPQVGLGTAEVYRACRAKPSTGRLDRAIEAWRAGDWTTLGQSLTNDLQTAAEQISETVRKTSEELQQLGGVGHLMTGSGSAAFVLCRSQTEAKTVAGRIRSRNLGQVWTTSSL